MPGPWKGIIGQPHTPATFRQYISTIRLTTFRPQFCVVHNTGIPTVREWPLVPGPVRMRGLESFYRDVKGWSAGPHLFIAPDFIWTFTPLWLEGVHAPSWNHVAWGVEFVGDYDGEQLNRGVFINGIAALSILHRFSSLNPVSLKYHKEDPKTTHYGCPGKNLGMKPRVIELINYALSHGDDATPALDTALFDFSDVESGSSSTAPTAYPVLRRGSRDAENVKLLQHLLNMQHLNAQGVFGPLTEQAVKDFQTSHGIQADGIVGDDTWRELIAESKG